MKLSLFPPSSSYVLPPPYYILYLFFSSARPVAVVCLAFSSFKVSDLSHFSYPVSILLSVLFSVVPIFVFVCFSSFPRLSFAWVFWLKLETTVFASSFFLSLYFFVRSLESSVCLCFCSSVS